MTDQRFIAGMTDQRFIAGLERDDQVYALFLPERPDAAGLTLRVLRGEHWHLIDASPHPQRWHVMTSSDSVMTLEDVLTSGFLPLGVIPVLADLDRIRLTLGLSWERAPLDQLLGLWLGLERLLVAVPLGCGVPDPRPIAGLVRGDQVFALLLPARLDAAGLVLRVLRGESWHLVDAAADQHGWEVKGSDSVMTRKDLQKSGFLSLGVIPYRVDVDRIWLTLGLSLERAPIRPWVEGERSTP